jgi:hypothetical protein
MNTKLFIFSLLGILFLIPFASAFDVNFVSSSEELLERNGFIIFSHDSASPLNCSLIDGSTEIGYPKTNIVDTQYAIYYNNLSYGYHNLKVSCYNGTDTVEVVDKFLIAEKEDTLPDLIVFLFVLFSPFFVKYFGIITKLTKNNPYFEFVIYSSILVLTFVYGSTLSVYYSPLLYFYARAVFGFSAVMSFIEILFIEISKINGGDKDNRR